MDRTVRLAETSLYAPVKAFLEDQGYSVKGEVSGCDALAEKDGVLTAIELKSCLSLRLILQAVARIGSVDWVYIAVPASAPAMAASGAEVRKLLRMLGIGLLLVDCRRNRVLPVLDPCKYRPRKKASGRARLLREHEMLVGDPNTGGSASGRGLMTVYRQRALAVAGFLADSGPSTGRAAASALAEPDAWKILYRNVYGWFERESKGVYGLSPRGREGLADWTDRWKQ